MFPPHGIMATLFFVITMTSVMFGSSEGIVSSDICPGRPNFVKSSPFYTNVEIYRSIDQGQNCTWVIERDGCDSGGIEVEIRRWDNMRDGDAVYVYDGPSSMYPPILEYVQRYNQARFEPKRSSGRFLTIAFLFKYDHYRMRQFNLRYRNTPKDLSPSLSGYKGPENTVSDTCGEEILLANQKPNAITSPGYPREYGNSLDCKWYVTSDKPCNDDDVIQVTIHTLSLEETYDHLVIYDGDTERHPVLNKLSGTAEPQVIVASGTSIVIEFKTDDTASGRGFYLSYIRGKATPLLSESVVVKRTDHTVEMSVDFISSTPHRAVYWSKNDVIIQQDDKHTFTVTPAKVSVESEPGVKVDGFTASLLIDGTESRDAGMYKMAVANEHGISERTLYVKRGHSVTMLPHYEAFPRNATITVTFSSDPDFKIEWYKKQRFLTPGSDVRVTTELVGEGEDGNAIYRSVLYPESPKQIHYGDYKFIIRKDIGTVETHILMDFPETELPKLLATPSPVEMRNRSLILTVNFDSNIAYPTVSWYHGDVPLRTSDRYRLELRWKGISSDWVAQGYPSVLPSTPFKLVTSSNSSYSYMYPSIGGNRSLTQLNANYTAVLTISDVKPADFGLYRVILENDAGATHHVIEVTAPEVFPYVTCDQADTIQLACNVTSCSRVTLSWIHSVDDDVVRNLPGHQDGAINTLTIPMCMHSDAGMYTCVAEEGTGSDVTIIHDTTTVTVRAVPVILESTVNISGDRLHIELPFYSYPPHHRVTWHRNGGQISPSDRITIGIEQHDVNLLMHGKTCRQVGHVTSVEVPAPVDEDFGTYKITISNKIGTSEHIIEVQNPKYINPVASGDVNVSYDGGSAVLRVTFATYYPEFNVKWYFKGEEIRENHRVNKYEIQTDNSTHSLSPIPAVPNSFGVPVTVVRRKLWKSSVLTVTCVSEKDYGKYDVLVSNKAGKAVIPVKLTKHGQGVPAMVGDIVTTAISSTREISAKFHSMPRYRLIKWFKDDKEITNDTSKYVIVNEDVDIEIPSSEESMKETGTITRLRVTSTEEEDYGLYRVQIYNDVGMIDGSATLDEDCK